MSDLHNVQGITIIPTHNQSGRILIVIEINNTEGIPSHKEYSIILGLAQALDPLSHVIEFSPEGTLLRKRSRQASNEYEMAEAKWYLHLEVKSVSIKKDVAARIEDFLRDKYGPDVVNNRIN